MSVPAAHLPVAKAVETGEMESLSTPRALSWAARRWRVFRRQTVLAALAGCSRGAPLVLGAIQENGLGAACLTNGETE